LRAQPKPPAERRFGKILEKLVDVLRRRSPSEQGDGRFADHDLNLAEFPLKLKSSTTMLREFPPSLRRR
jgi:hypothetical protein